MHETKKEHLKDWRDILSQADDGQYINYIEKLVKKTKSLSVIFELVYVFSPLLPYDETNRTTIKDAVTRVMWSNFYENLEIITAEELKEILHLLKFADENAKEFFYQTGLPELLIEFVKKPYSSHLQVYIQLLVTEPDERLIREVPKKQLLLGLVKETDAKLSDIINSLAPSEEDIKELFRIWMTRSLLYPPYCEKLRFLVSIDLEIISLANAKNQAIIAESAIKNAMELLEKRQETPISAAETIDSLKSELLKRYFTEACRGVMQREDDLTFKELVSLTIKRPQSWTLEQLLIISMEYKPLLKYEEVENMLLNENFNSNWVLIIEHFELFSKYKFVDSLWRSTETFALSISIREIIIEKVLLIGRKVDKQQLCHFIKLVLGIRNQPIAETFDQILETSLKDIQQIEIKLAQCTDLLNEMFSAIKEKATIIAILDQFKKDYTRQCIANFKYPVELQNLIEANDIVKNWRHSELFQSRISGQSELLAQADLVQFCRQKEQALFDFLGVIMQDILGITTKQVLDTFGKLENWENEIEILKKNISNRNSELDAFKFFLTRYKRKEEIKTSCHTIQNLPQEFGMNDCSMQYIPLFLEHYPKLDNLLVLFANDLFKGVESELYPEGELSECINAMQIINIMTRDLTFIGFLNSLFEEKLRVMLECVSDSDKSTLTVQDIMELKNVWYFWLAIRHQQSRRETLKRIIEKMKPKQEKK